MDVPSKSPISSIDGVPFGNSRRPLDKVTTTSAERRRQRDAAEKAAAVPDVSTVDHGKSHKRTPPAGSTDGTKRHKTQDARTNRYADDQAEVSGDDSGDDEDVNDEPTASDEDFIVPDGKIKDASSWPYDNDLHVGNTNERRRALLVPKKAKMRQLTMLARYVRFLCCPTKKNEARREN